MNGVHNGLSVLALAVSVSTGALAQATGPVAPPAPTVAPATSPAPASSDGAPARPLILRVEQDAPIRFAATGESSFWSRLGPILAPLISGIIALGGVWLGLKVGERNTQRTIDAALRNSDAAINQKANETELKEMQEKLNTFYGPYIQRSEENRLLQSELRNRQPDPTQFRTLLKLLDPEWLKGLPRADQTLVKEIVSNGEELRDLIRKKAGAVDPAVLPHLATAGTHFTLLKLAHDGALDNDPDRFSRYVYPRNLDKVLKADMARLKRRSDTLQSRPSERHGPLEALVIPPELALAEAAEDFDLRTSQGS